ncbi:hypothetical protein Tco_0205979 [Tanacetum coccineum]
MTHPCPKRNMVPKAVLMKSGPVSLTTARPVNTAQPRTTVKSARPMTNDKKVKTVKPKAVVNTARPKAVLNAVKGNKVNAVKASAFMDPNSSLRNICLGENIVEILSDKIEGSGDWDSPEYQDTTNSGGKKETKAMVFHKMDTEEVSNRFMASCFVNELEEYDGEMNLGVEENMISNEYAFIINPDQDDVELGVIFGRSFLCITKAITDFGAGTITIYPDIDPFLEDTKEEEKSMDD